jgi:antitoxin (DNA-binding transcriptional repressor) of toxin-antitoxin stability system
MARATALEFQRRFGSFQDLALREPVEITRHGRSHLVLINADEYRRLVRRSRRAFAAEEVPDDVLDAVRKSRMSRRHAGLNRLLRK